MLNIMCFIVLSVIKYDVSCKDNCFFVCLSTFLYDVKCCSCCVVVFLSIYKFKILVFCFGGWFIGMYFCGRNSRGVKVWVWIVILTND